MTMNQSLNVTRAGHVSLVPSYAEVGDETWLLVGQVLYVFRGTNRKDTQWQRRIHEFLGEGYIHGLMGGETADLNRAVDGVILE